MINRQTWVLACAGLVIVLSLCGFAQNPSGYTYLSPTPSFFGNAVSDAGDVNGDGFDDFVIAARYDDTFAPNAGAVRVYSGVDGSLIHTFVGGVEGESFGLSVSGAGDVNGDGFDDIVVGTMAFQGVNEARVFSGFDGSVLHVFTGERLGLSVSDVGDLDGDGCDDVLVGGLGTNLSSGELGFGLAQVFSGSDGSTLFMFYGETTGDRFGRSVSGAGDVNGDGIGDIIVGAFLGVQNGTPSGMARVFSGVDGSILFSVFGDSSLGSFGWSVSGAGDTNGDGHADFIVGDYSDSRFAFLAGSAHLFSGADGTLIRSMESKVGGGQFGTSVSSAGDVNGDGHTDVIVGMPNAGNGDYGTGLAFVFSGFDGRKLYTLLGNSGEFGGAVSGIGDVNGDGLADFIVGGERELLNGFQAGSARVFFADSVPVEPFTTGLGVAHYLELNWQRNVDTTTGILACTGAHPSSIGLFVSSLQPADTLLYGFLPVLVGMFPSDVLVFQPFGFDPNGAIYPPVVRSNPALAGLFVYVQAFELSPLLLSSNGLRIPME